MWQATPCTFGSSKPSTTIRSLGPSQRNRVFTWPVVPRSGRLHIQPMKASTSTSTHIPAIAAIFFTLDSSCFVHRHATTTARQSDTSRTFGRATVRDGAPIPFAFIAAASAKCAASLLSYRGAHVQPATARYHSPVGASFLEESVAMSLRSARNAAGLAALLCLIAACGGGGTSSSAPPLSNTPPPSTPTVPVPETITGVATPSSVSVVTATNAN